MATYGPHGLVIPEYLNSANGPDAFQRFAQSIEKGLYGTAVDEADRDTRYADIPVGGMVTSSERRAVWMRIEGGWLIVAEDTGWRDSGVAAAPGWSLSSGQVMRRNGTTFIRIEVVRTGGDINANTSGNLADTNVASISAPYRPDGLEYVGSFRGYVTSGSCRVTTGGTATIMDAHSGSTIATDQFLVITAAYPSEEA